MQVTPSSAPRPIPLTRFKSPKNFRTSTSAGKTDGSRYPIDEINAYIAIRDDLLAEAEATPTSVKLESVAVANDFVAAWLLLPQSFYKAQHLPETDAARERERCEHVKNRIIALRGGDNRGARKSAKMD